MARPKRNNADYFPHDSGLRNDPRVKALRTKYGLNGYAVFVMLLESITDADGLSLHWTDTAVEIMAGDFACESDYLREILGYCVRINLLQLDDAHVQSFELSRDLEPVFEKRKRAYAAFLSQNDTETTSGQIESAAENTQSKEEKRREKKTKVKFVAPSLEEVIAYFTEKGYREDVARKAFQHYEDGDWTDSKGTPVVNWKQKMRTNWMNDKAKTAASLFATMVMWYDPQSGGKGTMTEDQWQAHCKQYPHHQLKRSN